MALKALIGQASKPASTPAGPLASSIATGGVPVVVFAAGSIDVTQPTLATLLNYCLSKSYMTQAMVNALFAVPPT